MLLFVLLLHPMRWLKDIPHERYRIQVFQYNDKFIVKIELGQFEQLFKINSSDLSGLEEVEKMVTNKLLSNSLHRFISMRDDWEEAFQTKNTAQ